MRVWRVAADIKDQCRASRSPARPNAENYTKFAVRNADQTLRAVFAGLQTRRVIRRISNQARNRRPRVQLGFFDWIKLGRWDSNRVFYGRTNAPDALPVECPLVEDD